MKRASTCTRLSNYSHLITIYFYPKVVCNHFYLCTLCEVVLCMCKCFFFTTLKHCITGYNTSVLVSEFKYIDAYDVLRLS